MLRLLCIPFAGGGTSVFRRWVKSLPAWVEPFAAILPGRELRFSEPLVTNVRVHTAELALALGEIADKPWVVFGHSVGALIGFELCRQLRAAGEPMPRLFIASGAHPPHVPDPHRLHALSDPELLADLRRFGGVDPSVLEDATLMKLFLPVIRADAAVSETYSHSPGPVLSCPIAAYGGRADPLVPAELVGEWRQHTSATFRERLFDGGHFFFQENQDAFFSALREDLASVADAPASFG